MRVSYIYTAPSTRGSQINGTCYPRNELNVVTVDILQAVAGGSRPNILECGGKAVNTGY
jgi:hypothetical protein